MWALIATVLLVAILTLLILLVVAATREDPQWPPVQQPEPDPLEEP